MDIEQQILRKLMYGDAHTYNKLREDIPSNKFSYHLTKLVEQGIIEKKDDQYGLTAEGIHLVSSLDGEQIKMTKKPIVCVFVLGYKDDKILVNQRKKQPFLDVVGIPGGKVEFGSGLYEEAAKEFLEETGLSAQNYELKHITNYRTYDEDSEELLHHVIGFFFLATGLTGELIASTREGENRFVRLEDAVRMKTYPDFETFTHALLEEDGITFKEARRFAKDGMFTGIEYL